MTGIAAFLIDYIILNIGFYTLHMSITVASTVGFVSGMFVSFYVNRYWVHGRKGSERKRARQIVEYTLLVILNYIFTVFMVNFLFEHGIQPYVGKIIVMSLVTLWNYVIFSKVIFSSSKTN